MKRTRRLNRISHRRPKKPNRFWPIAIAVGAVGALLQFTLIGAVVVAIGAGANSYYQAVSTAGLQRLRQHAVLENVQPTVIEDRNGKHLLEIRDPNKGLQTIVPLKDIPVHYMQDALIATEDHTFWSNSGIDPTAIGRALKSTLTGGRVEGASTLTQQMVKRLVLNSQQTPQRKLQEIAIAYAAGQQGSGISKQDILYLYFNSVFFGHHATGIEAAARVYFGRHVWQLDLAQSALLAGLVNAPGVLDPRPHRLWPRLRAPPHALRGAQEHGHLWLHHSGAGAGRLRRGADLQLQRAPPATDNLDQRRPLLDRLDRRSARLSP